MQTRLIKYLHCLRSARRCSLIIYLWQYTR